jgi:hypothetical protein
MSQVRAEVRGRLIAKRHRISWPLPVTTRPWGAGEHLQSSATGAVWDPVSRGVARPSGRRQSCARAVPRRLGERGRGSRRGGSTARLCCRRFCGLRRSRRARGKEDRLRAIRDRLLAGGDLIDAGGKGGMKLWHVDDSARPETQQQLRPNEDAVGTRSEFGPGEPTRSGNCVPVSPLCRDTVRRDAPGSPALLAGESSA